MFDKTYINKFMLVMIFIPIIIIWIIALFRSNEAEIYIEFPLVMVIVFLFLFCIIYKTILKIENRTLHIKIWVWVLKASFDIDNIENLELIQKRALPWIQRWFNNKRFVTWLYSDHLIFYYNKTKIIFSVEDNKEVYSILKDIQKNK